MGHELYDPLLERIGAARVVLLGESTHGTHEFYRARAEITKRLIVEKGFRAVATDAAWPDAYRVNRFVRGVGADRSARAALADFQRFPRWRWRNADVVDFVGWLRGWNDARPHEAATGFYGLDLYALHASIAVVLELLDEEDPGAARRARARYARFEGAGPGPIDHDAAAMDLVRSLEQACVAGLVARHRRRRELLQRRGIAAEDAALDAEQNARADEDAERYYRATFAAAPSSWNLRDRRMAETLGSLIEHLGRAAGAPAKVVVWAHNSHVGDARATELARRGEVNIGQLARDGHGAVLVGFTTHHGTVSAAPDWGAPVERKPVGPPIAGCYEALLHEVTLRRDPALPLYLDLRDPGEAPRLAGPRLERAIGVVYGGGTETSAFLEASLPAQFDALFHFDETRAVEPLDQAADWERGAGAEVYPEGA